MPLYRRKTFPLEGKPTDLKANELVFQVKFTKEIFRDYDDYVKRVNLYRQRIWTCKLTGKSNLTYAEALASEEAAGKEAQQFPKELMEPVLRDVQFSMLSLKALVNRIATKLQGCLSEGSELYGRMNNCVYPCKIVRVVKNQKPLYQVSWMDKFDKVCENTLLKEEDLIQKKLPCSKGALKLFVRESTCRSIPWVLRNELAKNYGIPTHPPEELKEKFSVQDGVVVANRKRKKIGETKNDEVTVLSDDSDSKREYIRRENPKCFTNGGSIESNRPEIHLIKYPIDDLLLQPLDSDIQLTERPSLRRDFNVPMGCVGDLLMVWDFCISFGKLLHLSPFSLDDFENAISYKESNVVLVMEYHAALLQFLIKDGGEYLTAIQKKKRKSKITLITWTEFLCDFLEMTGIAELSSHISTIQRGHYGLLEVHAKLGILRELVAQAIESDLFKQNLDGDIEKRQALVAARRAEALEEGRKRREEQRLKAQSAGKEAIDNSHDSESGVADASFKNNKKQKINVKDGTENMNELDKSTQSKCTDHLQREAHKMQKNEKRDAIEIQSKGQRKEYLEREIQKIIIRTNPLGKDREYNTYWFFRQDARIFVESPDSLQWGYYCSKEELDALLGSLNVKGVRESVLQKQLEKFYSKVSSGVQKRTKEEALQGLVEEAVVRRSMRIQAPPRDNPTLSFLKYINKWKDE
ncbi:hypothetical protein DM860_013027 [Cuscuta australis]|uniref:DDT domain-containing protein n=1 Tax=Cuscuta australis TaxID=267555 RepID=A0A328D2Y8_9ASTE|nr:hypothetical protein DM860_013027 [Cuscuta australis]